MYFVDVQKNVTHCRKLNTNKDLLYITEYCETPKERLIENFGFLNEDVDDAE